MPFIAAQNETRYPSTTLGQTLTTATPPVTPGDLLLCIYTAQNATPVVAGWTNLAATLSNGQGIGIAYRVSTGSDPAFSFATPHTTPGEVTVLIMVIRDWAGVPTAAVVNAGTVNPSMTMGTLAGVPAGSMVIAGTVASAALWYHPGDYYGISGGSGNNSLVVGCYPQLTTGSTSATVHEVIGGTSSAARNFQIAIQNSVGGRQCQSPTQGYVSINTLGRAGISVGLSTVSSTILGATVAPAETTSVIATTLTASSRGFVNSLVTTGIQGTAGQRSGAVIQVPATSVLGGPVTLTFGLGSYSQVAVGSPITFVLADAAGNWSAWNIRASISGLYVGTGSLYTVVVDPTSPRNDGAGTLDLASITKVGISVLRTAAATITFYLQRFAYLPPLVFSGNQGPRPDWTGLVSSFAALGIAGTMFQQGMGQTLFQQAVTIGQSGRSTTFLGTSRAFELQAGYSYPTQSLFIVPPNSLEITLAPQPGDSITMASSLLAAPQSQLYTVATPEALSAGGQVLIGFVPAYPTGAVVAGVAFSACGEIAGAGALFSDCRISGGVGAYGMTIGAGASVENCSFTKGADSAALRITSAGTYSLVGTTFSGYTTDIHVSATSGTVTLVLGFGQPSPAYTTAGATVVIVLPQAEAVVQGYEPGSRIRVYNVTTATEVYNGVPAGPSWTLAYDDGVEFSTGDSVQIRATRQSGATAKLPFQALATVTASGFTTTVTQEVDTVYESNAIDGSMVTELTADYPNLHVDSTDADGVTQVQRIYAWAVWAQSTASGIRDLFNCILAEDESNYRVRTAVVNLRVDNVISTPLMITGGRLYRDDGLTVIAPTSNSIQLDPGKAYPVEVGTSGLTAGESALLGQISSLALETTAQQAKNNAALAAALSA